MRLSGLGLWPLAHRKFQTVVAIAVTTSTVAILSGLGPVISDLRKDPGHDVLSTVFKQSQDFPGVAKEIQETWKPVASAEPPEGVARMPPAIADDSHWMGLSST